MFNTPNINGNLLLAVNFTLHILQVIAVLLVKRTLLPNRLTNEIKRKVFDTLCLGIFKTNWQSQQSINVVIVTQALYSKLVIKAKFNKR